MRVRVRLGAGRRCFVLRHSLVWPCEATSVVCFAKWWSVVVFGPALPFLVGLGLGLVSVVIADRRGGVYTCPR